MRLLSLALSSDQGDSNQKIRPQLDLGERLNATAVAQLGREGRTSRLPGRAYGFGRKHGENL